ncbi:glycosyltransferase family 1 protein [Schinkia azotoformans]|uniref:glycosyltransferase family 1 protein n=1 Tax=Schinkia azotoformans TaxID=1454 RepID=UPI002E244DA9|nr:glycosyltransferase family 1 protein [Schinkia azotoformans]
MENKQRILHVLGGLNRGGAETLVMNLYRNIDRTKVQFDFVVHTDEICDYNNEILSLGGKIYSIPRYKGSNHRQYKKAWNKFFIEHPEYKIIHGHVRSTASIYLRIAKKFGLLTIAHSHSTSSGSGLSAIIKNIYQYQIRYSADYLFACSKVAGEWLYGKKACKQANFFILNNAIKTQNFLFNKDKRIKKRNELNVTNKYVVGHVGRFNSPKNHDFLIDIFKLVHEKNNNSVLMLVGDGSLKQAIEKKVEKLGLVNSVIFTGVRSDIQDLLQAMDVFVFPSLYEGLPVTVIEAQASGLPSLISERITNEVKITDLVKYLPLEKGEGLWAKEVLKHSVDNINRDGYHKDIVNAGYDIESVSNWYQEFIFKIIKNI